MTKAVLEYVSEKSRALMAAPSCCPEAKAAAAAWLAARGTKQEAAETKKYLAELKEDVTPIDGLIAFAGSDFAASEMGADAAKGLLAHARQIKAAGAQYCDCPACTAALAILAKEAELL
jgi:hypothetical protein